MEAYFKIVEHLSTKIKKEQRVNSTACMSDKGNISEEVPSGQNSNNRVPVVSQRDT